MRPRVPWMNETDDAILEFYLKLDEADGLRVALPPTAVWYNLVKKEALLDKGSSTISRRMSRLDKIGLLNLVDSDRAYYQFTDKGAAYLAGDLEADELELPDE
ncbi:homolog to phage PhiH1 repressor protein [Natronomonas pharaonis DSM 2160]|uniref:Homolog to phage PhiH1 repressor protein n=1 Tax=Natronomonas pharaonis (strain ATCC 35678 / DSM 2160 / CIP 103997 / JCM 8858 / NBRC 14720 / NCIMB 2260 / Gabara) TaxID=348780 RepID=A0A1U7EX58_NATPD|nr:hypothetical protein [Natronomonas pharaonis]CAI49718.2 homolog to phage PhiH1 repressor protein [Natronomonas pharaonis DSM 2160]